MSAKNKGGRPKKQINQREFEKLCGLQCTKLEICEWFGLCDETLERWCKETYNAGFSEVFGKKRTTGRISLRRNMMKMSEHNAAVAIFLAKNWLGMSDKQEHDLTSSDGSMTPPQRIEIVPAGFDEQEDNSTS